MLKKLSLVTASVVSAFAMHTAEININDKDLELGVNFDLGQVNDTVEPNTTFIGVRYLNGSDDNANTDISGYAEASFLMKREVQDSGIIFGIGLKTNYTKVQGSSYVTIPLGLEAGYTLPVAVPVIFGAKVYYAPQSLAFSKAESFLEYRADVSIEVIEKGSVILGYRNIDTNIETLNRDVNYNESFYFGFKFAF